MDLMELMEPMDLMEPIMLLCQCDFPGQNTRVGWLGDLPFDLE